MKRSRAFAVWLTGLPGSGKSTITTELVRKLADAGIEVAVLESDRMRPILTPGAGYDETGRDTFYNALVHVGALLTHHGVPVVFDATANRRLYRDRARGRIPQFVEVHVECPLEVCVERDPKGIYQQGSDGRTVDVPGLNVEYEAPIRPDIVVSGADGTAAGAADGIVELLGRRGYLSVSA